MGIGEFGETKTFLILRGGVNVKANIDSDIGRQKEIKNSGSRQKFIYCRKNLFSRFPRSYLKTKKKKKHQQ